jgi:Skp family chaperone for outer membrane proteins
MLFLTVRVRHSLAAAITMLLTLALITVVAGPSASAQGSVQVSRIAVLDSRLILEAMPARARAESQFALELAKARELVHSATDSLKAAVEQLSRHEHDLRPQQREAATLLLRARELEVEDMVAQLNMLAGKRQSELQAPLVQQIRDAVKTVRRRERFALVIDLANSDAVIDADEAFNITDQVIAELRRTASTRP